MGYECTACEDSTPARFLFTDLDDGATTSVCMTHLPDFLGGALEAVLRAQGVWDDAQDHPDSLKATDEPSEPPEEEPVKATTRHRTKAPPASEATNSKEPESTTTPG